MIYSAVQSHTDTDSKMSKNKSPIDTLNVTLAAIYPCCKNQYSEVHITITSSARVLIQRVNKLISALYSGILKAENI